MSRNIDTNYFLFFTKYLHVSPRICVWCNRCFQTCLFCIAKHIYLIGVLFILYFIPELYHLLNISLLFYGFKILRTIQPEQIKTTCNCNAFQSSFIGSTQINSFNKIIKRCIIPIFFSLIYYGLYSRFSNTFYGS